jgi:hypothetical protein
MIYYGSKVFAELAEQINVPLDQVIFLSDFFFYYIISFLLYQISSPVWWLFFDLAIEMQN